MAYHTQVILVPATLAAIGQWVDATFKYQQAFRGVHVAFNPSPTNICRFAVITVAGERDVWGYDVLTHVRRACPEATLDQIDAPEPAALRRALEERVRTGRRFGEMEEPAPGFRLRWPTDYPRTTQPFGANPTYYSQFKCAGRPLPGHEGIDIRAPVFDGQASKIYACAAGVVHSVHQTDDGKPYGARVRIDHQVGEVLYQTVYAHLSENSILVKPGDPIKEGQHIAYSGSTGNLSGAHLHLTFKKIGATAAGETDYPCDLCDPTPHLYWPDLRLTPADRLRVRSGPGTAHETLDIIAPGVELDPLDYDADVLWRIWHPDSWIKVRTPTGVEGYCSAEYLEIMGVEPVAPPLPMDRFVAGLDGRADGPMQEADFKAVELSRVEAVKLQTTASESDVPRLRQINPNVFIVVRLFEDFRSPAGPRKISAEQFAGKFRPNPPGQPKTDLQRFYDQGIRYFEVHNEPNLIIEGLGGSWNSGQEFGAWYLEVIDRLSQWFPEARWGFPGMSPGAAIPQRRQEMWNFLAQCGRAIGASDWLGIHQYFKNIPEMEQGLKDLVYEYRRRWPDKLLIITEFSNPHASVTKATKGQQYATFYRLAGDIPGVGAAFGFVSSASDPQFQAEAWREEDGTISPIVEAVAVR
jgi:murein DD-endopeptidase MepM/ murein hydrolase activator NlpD